MDGPIYTFNYNADKGKAKNDNSVQWSWCSVDDRATLPVVNETQQISAFGLHFLLLSLTDMVKLLVETKHDYVEYSVGDVQLVRYCVLGLSWFFRRAGFEGE
ncbi:unnamed protein product [Dovyalis caffra]|uniref:Uncharacterized protein n=1 Tax=Dovyalis caffra TaxID=77055 RepID=A0AAV1RC13_9ROSI|nr:unnamed protein product [Dovyalis caffra]